MTELTSLRALLLTLVLIPLLGAPSSGQEADFDFSPEAALPLDPDVRTGTLSNGLSWYVRENSEPSQRAELQLVVNVGSVLEEDSERGLAHFLEHMAFNGTEKYESQELVDYLERIGMRFGPDINALTGFDRTVYMLTVPTDDPELLDTGIQILAEWSRRIALERSACCSPTTAPGCSSSCTSSAPAPGFGPASARPAPACHLPRLEVRRKTTHRNSGDHREGYRRAAARLLSEVVPTRTDGGGGRG